MAAPRTGSTVLYQTLIRYTSAPYISNLTNNYLSKFPLGGLLIQRTVPCEVKLTSEFGKTRGLLQPSEGSSLMTRWFGASNPSQVEVNVPENVLRRMTRFFRTSERLFRGRPLIVKNAWNAYRLGWLANAIPGARFIWLRRDVRKASQSDLAARYLTKGDPHAWNSVPPSNHRELQLLQPTAQVVENQFQINNAISESLQAIDRDRWMQIDFANFMGSPYQTFETVARQFNLEISQSPLDLGFLSPNATYLTLDEIAEIETYCELHRARLSSCCLFN